MLIKPMILGQSICLTIVMDIGYSCLLRNETGGNADCKKEAARQQNVFAIAIEAGTSNSCFSIHAIYRAFYIRAKFMM